MEDQEAGKQDKEGSLDGSGSAEIMIEQIFHLKFDVALEGITTIRII